MLPFFELGSYSDAVAYAAGGLVVLALVAYLVLSRNTGREGEEWSHERTVNKALKALSKTSQAQLPRGREVEHLATDVQHLVEVTRTNLARRQRLVNWLRRRVSGSVVVHGMPITDANDRAIYVVSVDGRRLAHRDRAALVDDALTVAEAAQNGETPPATLSEYYYSDICDGRVDIDRTRSRVRGDCKTRIESNMRRQGELPKRELVETLVYDRGFRYPRHVVEEKLDELIGRDIREYKDGRLQWQRF